MRRSLAPSQLTIYNNLQSACLGSLKQRTLRYTRRYWLAMDAPHVHMVAVSPGPQAVPTSFVQGSSAKMRHGKKHITPASSVTLYRWFIYLRGATSQPVHLGVEPLLGLMTRFYLCHSSDCYDLCLMRRPIWRGGGSVICLKSVFVICKICTIIHIIIA
jgi:hypothetical protein